LFTFLLVSFAGYVCHGFWHQTTGGLRGKRKEDRGSEGLEEGNISKPKGGKRSREPGGGDGNEG